MVSIVVVGGFEVRGDRQRCVFATLYCVGYCCESSGSGFLPIAAEKAGVLTLLNNTV